MTRANFGSPFYLALLQFFAWLMMTLSSARIAVTEARRIRAVELRPDRLVLHSLRPPKSGKSRWLKFACAILPTAPREIRYADIGSVRLKTDKTWFIKLQTRAEVRIHGHSPWLSLAP